MKKCQKTHNIVFHINVEVATENTTALQNCRNITRDMQASVSSNIFYYTSRTETTATFCVKCMPWLYNGAQAALLSSPSISITVAHPL